MVADIKTLRERLGLTQTELAEALGVQPNTVARWERSELGISAPMMDRINALANTYRSNTVRRSSAVVLDAHHRAILDALGRRLDPETFEACAVALLSRAWPTLVPVRGGGDDGFDGAVADGRGEPFPLIVTTGERLVSNFARSLDRATSKGWKLTRALFATPRRITPHSRRKLYDAARTRGVTLNQTCDQDWFAQSLYREPEWCKRLLGVTGRPAALSLFPATHRPLLGDSVLGRKEEMDWLRKQKTDCLLVGEPGAGKTFLLRSLALEGHARFLVDDDRTQIANDLRSLRPAAVIVDDSHVDPDQITRLDQIRSETKAEFRIIATSWPGDADTVRSTLQVGTSQEMRLHRIDADTMVEIIKSFGIHGPDRLLYMIRVQAAGRPGLAATLAHLFRSGNAADVLSGTSLVDELSRSIGKIVDTDALRLLAPFALGGDSGVKQDAVSDRLGKSLFDVSSDLARLGAAGVIRETAAKAVSVQPEPMRWVIVKRVFFDGPGSLDVEPFLDIVEKREDALRTLLGARSRGAIVPHLEGWLETANSPQLWSDYASLGVFESKYVLRHHPDLIEATAQSTLRTVPETAIPMLLDCMVDSGRSSEMAVGQLKSWVNGDPDDMDYLLDRRLKLVRATLKWWNRTRNGPSAIHAMCIALMPVLEYRTTDPGIGRTAAFTSQIFTEKELGIMASQWPSVLKIVEGAVCVPWSDLFDLVEVWMCPEFRVFPPVQYGSMTRSVLQRFTDSALSDLARVTAHHPGIQRRIAELTGSTQGLHLHPVLEALSPTEIDPRDWKRQSRLWAERADELAQRWEGRPVGEIASLLAWCEAEMHFAGLGSPRLSLRLCEALAERVEDPVGFADALINRDLPSSFVQPFLLKALALDRSQWKRLAFRCVGKTEYRWIAVEAVLRHHDPPSSLLDEVLSKAADMPSSEDFVIASCSAIADSTIHQMLQSNVPRIAGSTAIGYWVGRQGKIAASIRAAWRQAILQSAIGDAVGVSGTHWLTKILSEDSDMAVDWLVANLTVGDVRGLAGYDMIRVLARTLGIEQRRRVLERLAVGGEIRVAREAIECIVGSELSLYRRLLGSESLKEHHLDPLHRAPAPETSEVRKNQILDIDPPECMDDTWRRMALAALEHGYSTQEVLYGTMGHGAWSWCGKESEMWSKWRHGFEVLLKDPDYRIAEIGRLGVDSTEKSERYAIRREMEEDVEGLD